MMGRVRLWRCLVDCRAPRPVARTTARRWRGAACLVALVCTIMAGCGGDLRLVPPAGPSPQTMPEVPVGAAATPVSTEVATRFGPIVWASAIDPATGAPIELVLTYPADAPRIVAAMQTFALSAGSVVEATWEYNNTSLDAFSTSLVLPSSTAERWISFHIERQPDEPWPVGTYQVSVSLNGTSVQQASIEVTQ